MSKLESISKVQESAIRKALNKLGFASTGDIVHLVATAQMNRVAVLKDDSRKSGFKILDRRKKRKS